MLNANPGTAPTDPSTRSYTLNIRPIGLASSPFGGDGVDPLDLLGAVGKLCIPPAGTDDNSRADRMIALLIDGLRYGANAVPFGEHPHLDQAGRGN